MKSRACSRIGTNCLRRLLMTASVTTTGAMLLSFPQLRQNNSRVCSAPRANDFSKSTAANNYMCQTLCCQYPPKRNKKPPPPSPSPLPLHYATTPSLKRFLYPLPGMIFVMNGTSHHIYLFQKSKSYFWERSVRTEVAHLRFRHPIPPKKL